MNRTYHIWSIASDEERAAAVTLCRNRQPHEWAQWWRGDWDGACVATDYQRRCKVCKKEQRGTGTAWGNNIKVTHG